MNRFLFLLLLVGLASGLVRAEIYKSIINGEVVYTDKPSAQAEEVELPGLSTYEPVPIPPRPIPRLRRSSLPGTAGYDVFNIQSPENGAVFRDNQGIVDVVVNLQPGLKGKGAHRIQYILDDELYGPAITETAIRISNLPRGEHTLSAQVVDSNNQVLELAGTVVFSMHRTFIKRNTLPQTNPPTTN